MWVTLQGEHYSQWMKDAPAISSTVVMLLSTLPLSYGADTHVLFVFGDPVAPGIGVGLRGVVGGLWTSSGGWEWMGAWQALFPLAVAGWTTAMASGVAEDKTLEPTHSSAGTIHWGWGRFRVGPFLVALSLLLLVATSVAYWRVRVGIQDQVEQLEVHRGRIAALAQLRLSIAEMEAAQVGYLAAGTDFQTSVWLDAMGRVGDAGQELRRRVGGHPVKEQEVEALLTLVQERVDLRRKQVHLRGNPGSAALRSRPVDRRGRPVLWADSQQLIQMEATWGREHSALMDALDDRRALAGRLVLGGTTLASLTGVMGWVLVRRSTSRRSGGPGGSDPRNGAAEMPGEAVWTVDDRGRIRSWSPGARRLLGWSEDEVVGRQAAELLQTGYPVPRDEWEQALRLTGNWAGRLLLTSRSGRQIEMESRCFVRRAPDGTVESIVESCRPVSGGLLGPSEDELAGPGGRGDADAGEVWDRAGDPLPESESLLRTVTDNARVGLVLVSAERRYLFANAAYQEMMGLKGVRLVGRHVVEILGPVYEEQVRPRMDRAFSGERICYEARRAGLPEGSGDRFFAVTYEPRWDAAGNVSVVVVIYDITDRKRVEAENAKLAAIVECSDDAIFSETLDGIVTSWNPGAERLFGYSESAALGQSALMLVPPERRDEEQAILSRLRRRERVDHFETVRQRADGSQLDVSLTVSPITDDEGRILGASMIARDITERKRAEQERSRQALVVENTGDFVGMWDLDGSLNYLNRAAREMVGLEQDEAMFRTSLGEFFFPEDRAHMVDEFIPQVLRAGRGEAEVRFRHFRTGEPLWVLFRVFLLRNDSGGPVGFATVSVNITERKRTEEALAIQNEVLDRIAAAAPLRVTLEKLLRLIEKQDSRLRAAICLVDSDGTRLRTGIAPSLPEAYSRAVNGIRIAEGCGPCGTAAWRRKLVVVEDMMTDPMGVDFRPLAALLGFRSCWSSPVLDSQGRILGTMAIYRDVCGAPSLHHERLMSLATHLAAIAIQRDLEEQILRDSEKRFRVLAETLPQMVWTGEPDGALDFLSRRWTEFTGVGVESQLGSRWMGQVHPEDRNGLQDAWHAALRSGRDFRHEFRVRGRDGQYRWFDTRAVPLRGETGQIIKWFGSNTDITERRRAEELLRDQVARVGLLNQITRAIGERQDLTSIFQVVVRDLEAHFPLDLGCVCLCEPGDKELSVSCLSRRIPELARPLDAAGPPRISIEANGLGACLGGQLVHEPDLELSGYPLAAILRGVGLRSLVVAPLQVERQVFGVLVAARKEVQAFNSQDCEFLRQLSEHVALAAHQAQIYGALQQAYNDLRQTQEAVLQQERLGALGQMASGIAHDINNAISPVALYTESLLEREPNLSERARGYLATIQRAIDDVAQTVARMREFCRKRRPQIDLVPLNLNRVVWQVLELTRVRWNDMPQERGWVIRAQTDLQAELPAIHGVESEIRDALTNLILNAVDAMPEGGTLGIKTRVLGREPGADAGPGAVRVMVEVSDTGMGMDETTRRRCLEPFFTTKGERGTGLGLAMVFGMVQRHGAQIDIESAPGLGTAIRLSFRAAPVASETPDGPALPARLEKPLRLLVVDDDPLLLKSLLDTLEADGHEVVVAEGGEEGIAVFHKQTEQGHRFDVVITDLGMPSVDGRKVAAAVKATDPRTPVILLTGWGQRMGSDGEHPLHVDYRLGKPPKLPELRRALTHCAGLSSRGDGI